MYEASIEVEELENGYVVIYKDNLCMSCRKVFTNTEKMLSFVAKKVAKERGNVKTWNPIVTINQRELEDWEEEKI